jgi:hypothetical protein
MVTGRQALVIVLPSATVLTIAGTTQLAFRCSAPPQPAGAEHLPDQTSFLSRPQHKRHRDDLAGLRAASTQQRDSANKTFAVGERDGARPNGSPCLAQTASSVKAPTGFAPMQAPRVKQTDGSCSPVWLAAPLPTMLGPLAAASSTPLTGTVTNTAVPPPAARRRSPAALPPSARSTRPSAATAR